MLTPEQQSLFQQQGYLVLKRFIPAERWTAARETARHHLIEQVEPVELESELQYPGAPHPEEDPARTIRRLKQAYDRDPAFAQCATYPELVEVLEQLLAEPIALVRAHHNCIMTKQPAFSSDSWWHQDIRYWRYQKGNLISAWMALGKEHSRNGGLMIVPGSHRLKFTPEQFDSESFFRRDLPDNQRLLDNQVNLTLAAGDLLLFHCRLLHAATRNYTEQSKLAMVFTYRARSDRPLPGSRSAAIADVEL
ncbi:MAG: phytanoyl-CoA dioxygenase family protein [Gammaproteobacteria bacterium]|nr:phytanoyl-CoA dioxygenase family protein [Gammaproteobacteria bacterium]NVK88909.1 phytanoyl-CoA dioxygenase family protein [Gammaproteobacteria bacterium]